MDSRARRAAYNVSCGGGHGERRLGWWQRWCALPLVRWRRTLEQTFTRRRFQRRDWRHRFHSLRRFATRNRGFRQRNSLGDNQWWNHMDNTVIAPERPVGLRSMGTRVMALV